MAKTAEADWFLQEWAATCGKLQNHLVTELEMHKNTANRLWHGDQPYRRDYVNQIAAWLNVRPYELFMHPDEAMAIRRLRESALTIASTTAEVTERQSDRTGTRG
jgi:transcriptional regulator with XRE-family HTH domain